MEIRMMAPDEAREVQAIGRKAFGLLEGLFIPKPKDALLALVDGKIVGAFVYKIFHCAGRKMGYPSFLFVHPSASGQGVGGKLCAAGVAHLWELGCDMQVTFVRDDNIASWGAFEKQGFTRVSVRKTAKLLGVWETLRMCAVTMYTLAVGHELYIATKDPLAALPYKKDSGVAQVIDFVVLNTLLLAVAARAFTDTLPVMIAFAFVFAGVVLAGFAGTVPSARREWGFRMTGGGGAIHLLIAAIGSAFPVIGSWYPDRYENTPEFRRDLALPGVTSWVFLLGLAFAGPLTGEASPFWGYASGLVAVLLVLRCLPVSVLGSNGFARVYGWNKAVYAALAAASVFVVFVM